MSTDVDAGSGIVVGLGLPALLVPALRGMVFGITWALREG
jgi:hypothetical protein